MSYDVKFSDNALKSLSKIDPYQAKIILAWIEKNLKNCADPRLHGKPLVGGKRSYWLYRVGSYRIIADIRDDVVLIGIVNVAHRREAYR